MRTLLKRPTLITILIGLTCALIGVSCQPNTPPPPTLTISPIASPTDIILTDTPTLPPTTIEPTKTLKPCGWLAYSDDKTASHLNNGSCSNAQGITISDDEKEINFFARLSPTLGTYGVCQDISNKNNLDFDVIVENSITSARFFVMISPDANPTTKLSQGFKIQPNILENGQKDIWIKFAEYVSDNNRSDYGGMKAIPEWKSGSQWNFNFVFKFDATQIDASMNENSLHKQWILNAYNRYLCFAYQQTPDAVLATNLEIKVKFP